MQQWLTDTERQLLASKPVGGLPETAREQLNTHMVSISIRMLCKLHFRANYLSRVFMVNTEHVLYITMSVQYLKKKLMAFKTTLLFSV